MRRTITDDSVISGLEFRARLLATGLSQRDFAAVVGVQRNAVAQWLRGPDDNGKVFPLYAQKVLEDIEIDIDALADAFIKDGQQRLPVEPEAGWRWGIDCWYVAMARARYHLADKGIDAVIGDPAPGRVLRPAEWPIDRIKKQAGIAD